LKEYETAVRVETSKTDAGQATDTLVLGLSGFEYADLYDSGRLRELLDRFDGSVKAHDPELFAEFEHYRACQGQGMSSPQVSALLVRLAPLVGSFIARLFNIAEVRERQIDEIRDEMESIFAYRNEVVMTCESRFKNQDISTWDLDGVHRRLDLLLEALARSEWERERAIAALAVKLWRLATYFAAIARGEDSSYPRADAEVRMLREGLEAGPETRRVFAQALRAFQSKLDEELLATVTAVHRLTPTIVEVIVRAPMQARNFSPGQFYRVQNLESLAPVVGDTVLAAEGLALTGAWVDKDHGLISLIALEMGSSSRLCALWTPGDRIVVMGVTGAPTEIPCGKNVLLAGGGLGNAVLFSIGKALRAARNRVIYFAGYKRREDVFKVEDIEAASDVIVWSVDPGPGVEPIPITRPQDKTLVGNILEAMLAYAKGALGATPIPLDDVDHLIVIGSDRPPSRRRATGCSSPISRRSTARSDRSTHRCSA
jgi:NAD(P)H-flavin reductase